MLKIRWEIYLDSVMTSFEIGLPFSYSVLAIIVIATLILTIVTFGILAAIILIICIYTGIIRFSPVLNGIAKLIEFIYPSFLSEISENIRTSFSVDFSDSKSINGKQHIFLFHPHGVFSVANIMHVGTEFTNWPVRAIKGTALNWLVWLPFGTEILERLHFVPSNYDDMRKVLESGESLSVCLGGVREILYTESSMMKLSILKKRGIFKLALEKGTPLVPVLSYGENELFDIMKGSWITWLQNILIRYGLCAPIPTIDSCIKWYGILKGPLPEPIRTVVGSPVSVPDAHEPAEDEIDDLRARYFAALDSLYEKTRPVSYSKNLLIV